MKPGLPLLGFAILLAQAVGLCGVYGVLQPASGSWLNVIVGSIGLASMIGMLVYSIARRSAALRRVFRLSTWLWLHIFLGLQGVLFSFVHCVPLLWRHGFPILVNPGMLNLYAVTVVFLSGLFGRYLYAQVPKTLGGRHLEAKALDAELAALPDVPEAVKSLFATAPTPRGFSGVLSAGRARRQALGALRAMTLAPEVRLVAERRVTLEFQKAAMGAAQRVFRYWIVLHRPVALAMYLLSFVHVAIAVMFSSSWGWR